MQAVFSISHSSDSWDFLFFLVGGKGESRLYGQVPCSCVCVFVNMTLQVIGVSVGKTVCIVTLHLCTHVSDKASRVEATCLILETRFQKDSS